MSPDKDDKTFTVKDRRFSAEGADEPKATAQGPGFTMKENEPAPTEPNQVDFSTLVLSLATSTMMSLGLVPDPQTKQVHKNLEMARQNIEILNILHVKTKGNLSHDEDQLLTGLLTEARLRFVEVSKK